MESCYHCNAVLETQGARAPLLCSSCHRRIDPLSVRKIAGGERVLGDLRADPSLDPALCQKLVQVTEAHILELRERARSLVWLEPVEVEAKPRKPSPAATAHLETPGAATLTPAMTEETPRERPVQRERTPGSKAVECARPSLWARLGPAFPDNLLFALATFLIVAGAVYFVTTAWTTMTGAQRLLVVVGALDGLGLILFLAGKFLNRSGAIPEVERVLLACVSLLMPIAAAATGELLVTSTAYGLVAALSVFLPGWFATRSLARLEDDALSPYLPTATSVFTLLVMLAPGLAWTPVTGATIGTTLLVFATLYQTRRVIPSLPLGPQTLRRSAVWIPAGVLAFTAIFFVGAVAFYANRFGAPRRETLPPLGVVLSGVGLAVVLLESGLARTKRIFPKGRSSALLVLALALAAAGVTVAAGNEKALLAAAVAGAWVGLTVSFRLDVALLLLPGLALSAVAYLFLPAPVRELAMALRDRAALELGYEPARLPLSFYGISFLPYSATCALAVRWLVRRGWRRHAGVLLVWTLVVAGGLGVLALTTGDDLRAPTAVLGAEGLLLFVVGFLMRHRSLVFCGVLGLFGGVACGVGHLELSEPQIVLVLVACGLALLGIAARLGRTDAAGFSARTAESIIDGVAVLALVLAFFFAVPDFVSLIPVTPLDGAASAALAVLLGLVACAYRRPEPGLLATLVLGRAAAGLLLAMGVDAHGPWRPVVFTAVSAVPLAMLCFRRFLGDVVRRQSLVPRAEPFALVPAGMIVLQGLGVLGATVTVEGPFTGSPHGGIFSWQVGGSVAAGAVVLGLAGVASARRWPGFVAALQLAVGGWLIAGALGREPLGSGGAAGLAAALLTLGCVRTAAGRHSSLAPLLSRPACLIGEPLSIALLVWLVVLRVTSIPATSTSAFLLALAGALVAIASFVAAAGRRHARSGWPAGELTGRLALAFVPIGLLDALRFSQADPGTVAALYPLGLVVVAAALLLTPRRGRWLLVPPLALMTIALALATGTGSSSPTAAWLLLAGQLGVAAGARVVARETTFADLGSLLFLCGLLAAISLGIADSLLSLHEKWQPLILLGFGTAALLAPRIESLAVSPRAALAVAGVIGVAATLTLSTGALLIAIAEPTADVFAHVPLLALLTPSTLVFFVFCLTAATRLKGQLGGPGGLWMLIPGLALVFIGSYAAPVNSLLHPGGDRFYRPDVEIALIALLSGLLLAPRGGKALLPARLGRLLAAPYLLAAAAVLLTAGELRDEASTSITFLVAMVVLAVLLWRDRRAFHAQILGFACVATGWVLAVFAVPETDKPQAEILPLLGTIAVTLAAGMLGVAARLKKSREESLGGEIAERLGVVILLSSALGISCLLGNVLLLGRDPCDATGNALAVACGVIGSVVFLGLARIRGNPGFLHGALVALLVLYAFLANRTELLASLEGYHLHTLAVIGAGLAALGSLSSGRLHTALLLDGLLLPLPAIAYSLAEPSARSAFALLLASVPYGLGALRPGRAWLGIASLVLVNLAVFSLWRFHGILDPAMYGVPAGLSVLLGTELARARLAGAARVQLLVLAFALVYGSVAIQVLRVEEPLHAAVMYGLGLASIATGLLRRRNTYVVAGTAAVVLDVIAYLARHGLERDFFAAALLLVSGMTVLAVATFAARRRRRSRVGRPQRALHRQRP